MNLTRMLFFCGLGGVVLVSLLAFTFLIGDGRLSGPGVTLALSLGTLVWVGRLLFQAARALVATGNAAELVEQKAASGRRRKELEREYYYLKRALKELELDHAMSKVSSEDYQEIRSRYRERAVRVLRQLDQGQSYRQEIEADLKARRAALQAPPLSKGPAGNSDGNASASRDETAERQPNANSDESSPEKSATAGTLLEQLGSAPLPLCEQCKTSNDRDAVFCKKCGQRLLAV